MSGQLAPVRKSLLRKIAWMGADRRLVGMSALISVAIGWTMFVGFGFIYGACIIVPIVIFSAWLWIAREMYRRDPWMIDVLVRHFKYKKYYAARSDHGVPHPPVRDFL